MNTNPPEKPEAHIPYNLMLNLVKVAPKERETQFIQEKLNAYGNLKEGDIGLNKRIKYALNWIEDFGEPEITHVALDKTDRAAIESLIIALNNQISSKLLRPLNLKLIKLLKYNIPTIL